MVDAGKLVIFVCPRCRHEMNKNIQLEVYDGTYLSITTRSYYMTCLHYYTKAEVIPLW